MSLKKNYPQTATHSLIDTLSHSHAYAIPCVCILAAPQHNIFCNKPQHTKGLQHTPPTHTHEPLTHNFSLKHTHTHTRPCLRCLAAQTCFRHARLRTRGRHSGAKRHSVLPRRSFGGGHAEYCFCGRCACAIIHTHMHQYINVYMDTYSCVYVYMCMCVYVCVCICVCVYMCICVSVYMCMCACVYVCICVCVYMCICVCVYVCICVCTMLVMLGVAFVAGVPALCIYVCAYVYMYVYILMSIYLYMHYASHDKCRFRGMYACIIIYTYIHIYALRESC